MKKEPTKRKKRKFERWIAVISLFLFFAIWELLADFKLISTLFFPAPHEILVTFWKMLVAGKFVAFHKPDFPGNLIVSLIRVALGVLAGLLPGVLLGLAMGWSKRVREVLDPFIAATNPIPKLAIFPLIMIIFGIGEASKIVSIAITTFFPMLINSMAGVRQLNPVYFEVAQNYGANRWKTFTRVVLPGSLPMILAGFRIAFSLAFVITIAVELLTANAGLGVLIWFSWETLRTEDLYATLFVISVVGYLINVVLVKFSYYLTPWYFRSKKDVN